MSNPYELSDDMPVYVISVAAQLSDMHPQTLRAYDRLGLVSPGRSQGRGRRYSMRDILALREVPRSPSCGWSSNPPALWRPGWPSCVVVAVTPDPGARAAKGSCRCAAPGSRS